MRLKNLSHVCVFAGENDVGKSNILKAINLFFNNETDWNTRFDFQKDFSFSRLDQVRKVTVKGKQFIQISFSLIRGSRYEGSLPERFKVTKTWHRDSTEPVMKSSIPAQFKDGKVKTKTLARALASLQLFLTRTRYVYVPAIKERYFSAC